MVLEITVSFKYQGGCDPPSLNLVEAQAPCPPMSKPLTHGYGMNILLSWSCVILMTSRVIYRGPF